MIICAQAKTLNSWVERVLAKRLVALGFVMLIAQLAAQDFIYTNINGTITITAYTGPGGNVTIPSTIDGLPVTRIGNYAFSHSTNLTSVAMPDSVTDIEDGAAPQGGAFGFCTSLTNVTVGSSVTNIGDFTFIFCARLTRVTIGQSVMRIGAEACRYCSSLTSVALPNSVVRIDEGAFWGCASLTNTTFGNNVANIGEGAFWSCPGLTSMTIPQSVVGIGEGAFGACTNLTAITVNALNSAYSTIDGVLFDKAHTALIACPGGIGPNYAIPESVNSIEGSAFAWCSSLTNITIPNSLIDIGGYAFYGCTSLPRITIPASVTSIDDFAFEYCTNLTSAYFAGDAPNLGGPYVFDGANNTTVYYLPGTTGWGTTFGGRPTALWLLPYPVILTAGPSFGIQANSFSFIISWATNASVVVEASTNLTLPAWRSLQTNALISGSYSFRDAEWTNYPRRFYRIRST